MPEQRPSLPCACTSCSRPSPESAKHPEYWTSTARRLQATPTIQRVSPSLFLASVRGRSGPRPPGQVAFPDRGENGSRTGADLDIDLGRDGRDLGVDLHRGDSHRLSHPHRFDDVLEHAARADTEDDVEASAKLVP